MSERFHPGNSKAKSSFDGLSQEEVATHLRIDKYNDLVLPAAIRPSYLSGCDLQQGYAFRKWVDPATNSQISVIIAAISAPQVMEVFCDLASIPPFKEGLARLVLESSHKVSGVGHEDRFLDVPDLSIALSHLVDFERSFLDDGSAGVSLTFPDLEWEIMLDEHKVVFVYGHKHTEQVLQVLNLHGITHVKDLKTILDDEHVHISSSESATKFEELRSVLEGSCDSK